MSDTDDRLGDEFDDEYDPLEEGDCCHHGVGFDEDCDLCQEEDEDE